MSKLSLFDKLGIFFNVAGESYWSLIVLIILLGIGLIFSTTNKKNIKRNKIIYIVFTITIIVSLLIGYSLSISKVFDNMMNNLFIAVYFPNLAIYFGAIITTSIILWISIFSYKTSELIKKLNLIIYLIMHYLFGLLLYIIKVNKLDIFSSESIYSNTEATALIELSSIIFIIWILFLIIYKIILIILRKDYKPKVKKVIVKKEVKKLPENYEYINVPSFVYSNKLTTIKEIEDNKLYTKIEAPKKVYGEIKKEKEKSYSNINIPEKIYGNNKKNNKELLKVYDEMFSIDDYKLLLKLLLKERQKEEKPVKKKKEEKIPQPNLTELEDLYRSIK